ncbi:MAG: hypothetical protein AAFY65_13635 [Pseudomonadota bacterium]
MRKFLAPLLAALALSACVASDASMQVAPAVRDIAVQRMRFAVEAVCLNNRTRSAQDRAARALGFPIRERQNGATVFVNPNTLTFLRIGPVDAQTYGRPDGQRGVVRAGTGCSVGSPAVGIRTANQIVGEILSPRLVEGAPITARPLGAGVNAAGGNGFFFRDLAVTMPLANTSFSDGEGGQTQTFTHPVILIIHQ